MQSDLIRFIDSKAINNLSRLLQYYLDQVYSKNRFSKDLLEQVNIATGFRINYGVGSSLYLWKKSKYPFKCVICGYGSYSGRGLVIHNIVLHFDHQITLDSRKKHKKEGYQISGAIKSKKSRPKKSSFQGFVLILNSKHRFQKLKQRIQKVFPNKNACNNFELKRRLQFYTDSENSEEEKLAIQEEKTRAQIQLKGLKFYHSQNTYLKVEDNELFIESEEEVSDQEIFDSQLKALDDYIDVIDSDKNFFKFWNKFIIKERKEMVMNNNQIPKRISKYYQFAKKFLEENKSELVRLNLKQAFGLHLLTLQMYSLLTLENILCLLREYDR